MMKKTLGEWTGALAAFADANDFEARARDVLLEVRDEGAIDMVDMLSGLPCTNEERVGVLLAADSIREYVTMRRARAAAKEMAKEKGPTG